MKGIEKFKRLKEKAKQFLEKGGTFINTLAKGVKKIQPVIDVVSTVVPYGNVIKEVVDVGSNIAEKAGRAMQDVGRGKNVVDAVKDNFTREDYEQIKRPVQRVMNKVTQNKPTKYGGRVLSNQEKQFEQAKKHFAGVPPPPKPQFLTNKPVIPPGPKQYQPGFMNNVLN